ncbi:MAG: hypothetical protein IJM17_06750 [Firmicutes bacterium]|nr:hypothetical protein [Bacillota bacterium]
MKNIFVSDLSLTKLEEERGRSLLFREKTAVCAFLDSIGADAIELPAIKKAREDSIVYRTIAGSVKRAALSIECGMKEGEIAAARDCVKEAARPVLRVSLPVSTAGMEYSFRMKAPAMLKKIEELCFEARKLCPSVEFEAKDATGAERDFLIEALKAAEAAGASAVSVSDDEGRSFPWELAELAAEIKAAVEVPLYVKCSGALGMAPACAAAVIGAGADGLKCAVGGGSCLDTCALSDLMRDRGNDLGAACGLDATRIHRDCGELMKKLSGEVYAPSTAAKEHRAGEIMLGSSCTLPQLSEAAISLGYELSDEDCGRVYDEVLRLLERKAFIGGRELEAVIAAYAMQVPSTYHLKSYVISAGNMTGAMASISLVKNGEEISAVARGDGPIDAAFFAIEQAVGYRYELDDFQIQAVTEGKDSLGSTLIRLRSGGRLFSGNGLSTDIVGASIRAYINALNKIIYEEGRKA